MIDISIDIKKDHDFEKIRKSHCIPIENIKRAYRTERSYSVSDFSGVSEFSKRTFIVLLQTENETLEYIVVKFHDYSKKSASSHNYLMDYKNFIERYERNDIKQCVVDLKIIAVNNSTLKNSYLTIHKYFQYNFNQIQILYKNEKIDILNIIKILCDVATAIDFFHDRNAMHRSVSRYNILAEKGDKESFQGYLLPSPFFKEAKECYTHSCGTGLLFYRSPEMIIREDEDRPKYDKSVDIWSFGIILYETFFQSKYSPEWSSARRDMIQLAESVRNKVYPELQRQGEEELEKVEEIEKIIEGCLKVNPKERFSSQELLRSMKDLIDSEEKFPVDDEQDIDFDKQDFDYENFEPNFNI